ncbi:MAG: C-GCAxxG-C-C family protein [Candidatus Odinarchaeota archaeon]
MKDNAVAKARTYFSGKYNCAQSVMKAVLSETKMDFDQVIPLSAGFGGGVAHEGSVCGAVSGAIAALGILNSRQFDDVAKHKEATYASSEEFIRRFKRIHGSILCNDLTGIDMSNLKARNMAMKDGIFERVCPSYVESAVRIALELSEK